MNTIARIPMSVARAVAMLVTALAMVMSLATPGLQWVPASTTVMIGGLNQPTLSDGEMAAVLNGRYAGDTLVSAEYPAQAWPFTGLTSLTVGQSVDVGIGNLEAAIREANPAVVVGISEGSLVLDEVQRRLAATPDAPQPDEIEFVTIAGLNRGNGLFTLFRGLFIPIFNYTPQPEPVTPYHTTVIMKEYDGWADFPDRPWNLLSALNAIAGSGVIPGFPSEHNATINTDLSQVPDSNVTTTTNSAGGITKRYLVPTPDLPLLRPLGDLGFPAAIVDALNALLKPIVDAGYSRNDPQPTIESADTNRASALAQSTTEPSTSDTRKVSLTSASADTDHSSADSDKARRDAKAKAGEDADADKKAAGDESGKEPRATDSTSDTGVGPDRDSEDKQNARDANDAADA
jgi:hypothetical protein